MKHSTIHAVSALLLLGMLASCGGAVETTDAPQTSALTGTSEAIVDDGPVFPDVSYSFACHPEDGHILDDDGVCTGFLHLKHLIVSRFQLIIV